MCTAHPSSAVCPLPGAGYRLFWCADWCLQFDCPRPWPTHTPAVSPLCQDFTDLFAKARQKTGVSSTASGLGGDGTPAAAGTAGKRKRQVDPRFDLDADEDSVGSEAEEDPNDRRRREKGKRYKKERAIQAINQDSRGILQTVAPRGDDGERDDGDRTYDRRKILRAAIDLDDLHQKDKVEHRKLSFKPQRPAAPASASEPTIE